MRVFQPPGVALTAPPGAAAITDGHGGIDAITGALPGDYYAIALDDLSFEAIRNPAVLERLARFATRLTIRSREPGAIGLRRESFAELLKR
jgi:hypothetical protein